MLKLSISLYVSFRLALAETMDVADIGALKTGALFQDPCDRYGEDDSFYGLYRSSHLSAIRRWCRLCFARDYRRRSERLDSYVKTINSYISLRQQRDRKSVV